MLQQTVSHSVTAYASLLSLRAYSRRSLTASVVTYRHKRVQNQAPGKPRAALLKAAPLATYKVKIMEAFNGQTL